MERSDDHDRVLALGLDGAPWSLLDPWLAQRQAAQPAPPDRQRRRGDSRSTIPYITAAGLDLCVTGINPGKHGVFDFAVRRGEDYGINVVNSTVGAGASRCGRC